MTSCIYCANPADSLEHPLPAAFGEFDGAPLLEDRICKKCNNERLGILDEQITRCGREGFFRRFYGVQGRETHEKINPFERGSAGGGRLDMRGTDPQLGYKIGLEYTNGEARQLRQIVFVESSGKVYVLPIRVSTTSEQLLAAYRELGVTGPCEVRVFSDPDESAWVEPLITATWPSVTFGPGQLSGTTYEDVGVKLEVTGRYFQAIAKIGFHYFLTQFPEYRGDESIFSNLREYILETGASRERANDFIGIRQTPLLGEMLDPQARPDGWRAHCLCAEVRPNECLAYVQMFLSEDAPSQTYTVRLANDPSLIECRASGHGYIYFEDGPKGRYSGEVRILGSAQTDSPPPPPAPVIT